MPTEDGSHPISTASSVATTMKAMTPPAPRVVTTASSGGPLPSSGELSISERLAAIENLLHRPASSRSSSSSSAHPNNSHTSRPDGRHQAELDVSTLEQNVQFYLQAAVTKSTMRSYTSGYHRYSDFCSRYGYQPLPMSETVLCKFVTFLGQQQLKHQTISLVSVSSTSPTVEVTPSFGTCPGSNMSIKAEEAKKGEQSWPHLPITLAILTLLRNPSNLDNIMLQSASLLCFLAFCKTTIPYLNSYDPTIHLNYNEISVDNPANPSILQVKLKCFKIDPFRPCGKKGRVLCPVSALLKVRNNNSNWDRYMYTVWFDWLLHKLGSHSSA